jgi:hypothetical protein
MSNAATQEKVIYQYTLVKKIRRKPFWILLYGGTFGLFGAALQAAGSRYVWLAMISAFLYYVTLEFIVISALSWARPNWDIHTARYRWMGCFPWIGYFPEQAVPFRYFYAVQIQSVMVGCISSGISFGLLPLWEALAAAFAVLWTAASRLWLLLIFQTGGKNSHLIRFSGKDVSLYMS